MTAGFVDRKDGEDPVAKKLEHVATLPLHRLDDGLEIPVERREQGAPRSSARSSR